MFAGGEIWMLTAMSELKKRGHYVHLLCRPGTELEKRTRAIGFPISTVKIRGDLDPITIWQTKQLIKRQRITVVLTNMDKELRFAGIAARLAGVMGIFPRRGIDFPLKNNWRYRFFYNVIATRIIANSHATKRSLLLNAPWLAPDRIIVIHNGIDPAPYLAKPAPVLSSELNIPPAANLIGFVGQLDERKGIDTLLQAFLMVQQQFPAAILLVVGTGPLAPSIQHWVTTNHLIGRVILTGFRDDIVGIMKKIQMLVLPSFWEGFGIVLIEAMAAGKPVVTTQVSSMPEIVEHNKSGFLIEPGNVRQLADAITTLLTNPVLAQKFGNYGQKRVIEYFNLQRMIDELENVLKIRE